MPNLTIFIILFTPYINGMFEYLYDDIIEGVRLCYRQSSLKNFKNMLHSSSIKQNIHHQGFIAGKGDIIIYPVLPPPGMESTMAVVHDVASTEHFNSSNASEKFFRDFSTSYYH